MSLMIDNLRKQKRIRLDLAVEIKTSDMTTPVTGVGQLVDLSIGGCSFWLDHEIPIGSRIEVKIALNDALAKKFNKPNLIAHGAVCRIEKRRSRFLISTRFFR